LCPLKYVVCWNETREKCKVYDLPNVNIFEPFPVMFSLYLRDTSGLMGKELVVG
jgi:hypothetical protein